MPSCCRAIFGPVFSRPAHRGSRVPCPRDTWPRCSTARGASSSSTLPPSSIFTVCFSGPRRGVARRRFARRAHFPHALRPSFSYSTPGDLCIYAVAVPKSLQSVAWWVERDVLIALGRARRGLRAREGPVVQRPPRPGPSLHQRHAEQDGAAPLQRHTRVHGQPRLEGVVLRFSRACWRARGSAAVCLAGCASLRPFVTASPCRRSLPPCSGPFASSTRKRQNGCSSLRPSCAGAPFFS